MLSIYKKKNLTLKEFKPHFSLLNNFILTNKKSLSQANMFMRLKKKI